MTDRTSSSGNRWATSVAPHAGDTVAELLGIAERLARQLRLPYEHQHLYDDIVQDTMLVVLANLAVVDTLDPGARVGWVRRTMFYVTRNTQRSELRRTAAWHRFRDVCIDTSVAHYFDQHPSSTDESLTAALGLLSELDQRLVVEQVWQGFSARELAARNGLTEKAVRHRLTRARTTLRENLLQMGQSEFPADIT